MKFEAKIEGVDDVARNIRKLAAEYPAAVGASLFEEGQAIQAASQQLVPVDTGRLRASAYTNPPREGSDGPEVTVGYGTTYALPVHERVEAYHATGQAKFLEAAFNANMRGFLSRLSERIKYHVERGTDFGIIGGQR